MGLPSRRSSEATRAATPLSWMCPQLTGRKHSGSPGIGVGGMESESEEAGEAERREGERVRAGGPSGIHLSPVVKYLRRGDQSGAGAAPLPAGSEKARRQCPANRRAKAWRSSSLRAGIQLGNRTGLRPLSRLVDEVRRAAGRCGPIVAATWSLSAVPREGAWDWAEAEPVALRGERLPGLSRGRPAGGTAVSG